MTTVRQLPTRVDAECVAGDPFTATLTATSGVTTFSSPACTMTTGAGDSFTTDPGVPTASAVGAALSTTWSAADTAALNTSTKPKTYKWSTKAIADGGSSFQWYGGTLTVHPVGTTGISTTTSTSATVVVGGVSVDATIMVGTGSAGAIAVLDPDDNYDATTIEGVLAEIPTRFPSAASYGNRTAFLGDSITRGGQSTAELALSDLRYRSASIPTWASVLSRQRVREVVMAGVDGDTVADMLERFDTDVTPYAPNVVVILGGTNDTNSLHLTTLTDYAATMTDLIAKVRQIGARPVLCTIPPHRGDGAVPDRKTRIAKINHWLRRWAVEQGITLIDLNALWSDRATDDYATAYIRSADSTHPSEQAYYDAGALIASTLGPTLPDIKPPMSSSNVDPLNKIANGQFLGSLTSGVPSSWTGPVVSGVTGSQVTNDTTISGYWYKMTSAGHASTNVLMQTVTGIVGGHTYAFACLVKTDVGGTGNLLLRLMFNNSSTAGYEWRPASLLGQNGFDIPDGALYLECLAPSDATTCVIEIRYGADTSGYVQVANLTLIDLADIAV